MDIAGYIGHQHSGIILYKGVWPATSNFQARLEKLLNDSQHPRYRWSPALIGDGEINKDYRDCSDFKVNKRDIPITDSGYEDIQAIYNEVMTGVRECVKHYSLLYNIDLQYEESTNFVQYTKGQHFSVHPDAGFSYSCTVSSIGYLNDGYEGGEYVLPYQDIKFKPEMGDVIVHPSNFIYAHASMPVTSGIKYSAVTMYDYNDRNHQD